MTASISRPASSATDRAAWHAAHEMTICPLSVRRAKRIPLSILLEPGAFSAAMAQNWKGPTDFDCCRLDTVTPTLAGPSEAPCQELRFWGDSRKSVPSDGVSVPL